MVNLKKKIFISICLLLVGLIAFVIINQTSNSSSIKDEKASNHTMLKTNIGIVPFSQDDLVDNSDYIVEANVINILESTIEVVPDPLTNEATDSIVTDTRIRITNVIKGCLETDEIVVRSHFGTVENTTLVCQQEVKFKQNEKVLLFLYKDIFSETYRVTGYIYGKYVYSDANGYINEAFGNSINISDLITK